MEKHRKSWSTSPRRRRGEKKGGLLAKALALARCRSLGGRPAPTTPAGCFAVLVGPERERFAVRAERANHPRFRALLEEAEAAYGFPRPADDGPLLLPCGVEEFVRVMSEVERDEHDGVLRAAAAALVAGSAAPSWSPAWRCFVSEGGARAGYLKMSSTCTDDYMY
ncbi:hypothetical protein BS78_06G072200 [Paspalum vaginatum]|nr:hypothetical protein BS78_06G072200 [Paspalum vaginatum]